MSVGSPDRDYAIGMMEHLLEVASTDHGMRVAILAAANGILVSDAAVQQAQPPQAHLAEAIAHFARQAQASLRGLFAAPEMTNPPAEGGAAPI